MTHKRVARIMREHGWAGVMGRIRVRTTRRDKTAAPAPDLVARGFNPDAPDRIWAGDVTYTTEVIRHPTTGMLCVVGIRGPVPG